MDLDIRQTRQLFLAGASAFPTPFPGAGTIWFERGTLTYAQGERPRQTDLILLEESSHQRRSRIRVMLQKDVSALFIPGKRRSPKDRLRISCNGQVHDLEEGEWFLDADVNAKTLRKRLRLPEKTDIKSRRSVLRGIVFVGNDRPVITISEQTVLAGGAVMVARPGEHACEKVFWPGCEK
jgi:hypothetical protein